MKRAAAVIAALMLVTSTAVCLPKGTAAPFTEITASAETYGDFEYQVLGDGNISILKYNGNADKVSIPASINGKRVVSIGEYAFYMHNNITDITIPDTVLNIGSFAFSNCRSLNNIDIPDSVVSINIYAFYLCSGLTSVSIPASVASIGNFSFYGCTSLTNISVSKDNPYYSAVDGVLFNKDKTVIISYPAGKTSDVYSIPSGVVEIGNGAFAESRNLKTVIIPKGVSNIGSYAFCSCSGLTVAKLPDSIIGIDKYAFNGCSKLAGINIPEGVNSIGSFAFQGTALTSVSIPDSVTSIGDNAFDNKKTVQGESLRMICCKGTAGEKYAMDSNIAYETVYRDISEADITVNPSAYVYDGTAKNPSVTVKKYGEELTLDTDYIVMVSDNIEIGTATVTVVGKGNFSGTKEAYFEIKDPAKPADNKCGDQLTWEFSTDGTLTISGKGDMYNYELGDMPWSKDSDKIKKVVIGEGVESICCYAFSNLEELVSVELSDSLRIIDDYAFCNDRKLSSVNNISPSLEVIGCYAFDKTAWLEAKRSEDPMVIVNGVLIDGAGCKGKVKVPEGTKIISAYSFSGNSAITSVELPNDTKYIRQCAFKDCTSLTDIYIDKNVVLIYDDAFSGCSNDLTIHALKHSYAEMYAFNNKINYAQMTYDFCTCLIILPQDVYVYAGKPIEPFVTVILGDNVLLRDIDYVVEYNDNDRIGTADVTIRGINDYSGVAWRDFTITGSNGMKGDVNNDGLINISDISKTAAHVKGKKILDAEQQIRADVNGDGKINVTDISKIAAHVKGKKLL
ncbi:leucine-rich repeat protein [Ruminococcus albus]|uniref:Leucine rich repeat-containing protein n=1 Tax=Ruminococcus albus TaxID=1264 RepID=A0A1I1R0U1_RUMAL|nr:leucine-rich repeat protein [Ruminococcus albus]SFD27847.1 Leucine rich repeat-containing protein [Ruminococcus albus]